MDPACFLLDCCRIDHGGQGGELILNDNVVLLLDYFCFGRDLVTSPFSPTGQSFRSPPILM